MKPLKNKVSITLDEDVIERIKQLAESDDRSFSQYINMVLKDYLNKVDNNGTAERCLPIRKHRGAREKRYSFGYAVFLILALMK